MMEKYSFKKSLKLTKFSLKFAGVDLDKLQHRNCLELIKQTWFYYFCTLWIQSTVVGEICWCWQKGVQSGQGFAVLTFLAPCMTYGIMGTVKTAFLLIYGTMIKQLLKDLESMFPSNEINDERDDEEETIIQESMSFLGNIVSFLFYMDLALLVSYGLRPLWILAYKFLMHGEIEFTLLMDMSYPFDPLDWHVWPFTYLYQLWAGYLVTANILGGDTIFFVCCTHIHMHFRILRLQLSKLVTGGETDTEVHRKLVELTKLHQKLIQLVEMLEHIFSKSNFFNCVASSFLICLTGFNVTTLHDKSATVIFLIFLSSNVTQIFLICFFGDMIMDSSSKISDGLYNCKWYNMSTETRKDISFILLRSQRPCKLTAMKFGDINIKTFTTILSRAWSYFALLNTLSSSSAGQ